MAVLVTGGAGYIGSHMVLNLVDAGVETIVLDSLVTGFDWAVDDRARLVEGNIEDTGFVTDLIKAEKIEEIVHFAGSIIVPESVENPLKYYANNTCASRNLIEAAVLGGVERFVFSSTAAVYGMTGLEPVSEDMPLNPMSPYGCSKLMTEQMLGDVAAAHGMIYGVLRYFNVAGADPKKRSGQSTKAATHLIKVAAQVALGTRDHLDVYGTDYPTPDGTCIRDYIHVSDLVEAHALLLEKLRKDKQSLTLNCGYGHGFSVREVVDMVKKVSGVDFQVRETARRAGDPPAIVAGANRIRQVLDWQPRHDDLSRIVRSALEWESYLRTRNR